MSLINSFKVFREIYLLKGDYPYPTMYMLQHFMNNTFSKLDYQKMSAAAIMMAVVMVIIIGTFSLPRIILERMWKDELEEKGSCGALEPPAETQEEN